MKHRPTLILVGESPPLGALPDARPFDDAVGDIIAKRLGLVGRAPLVEHVRRVHLFDTATGVDGAPSWPLEAARIHAIATTNAVSNEHRYPVIALLGPRVADAFDRPFAPIHYIPQGHGHRRDIIVAPGPTNRLAPCARVREFRRGLIVDLAFGSNLRALDFRLGDIDVLTDLSHALCPRAPQIAAAVLRLLATMAKRWVLASLAAGDPKLANPLADRKAHVLASTFAETFDDPARVLEACFVSAGSLVSRTEWGFGRKSDKGPYGDDLARAVLLDPTLARACAMRAEALAQP